MKFRVKTTGECIDVYPLNMYEVSATRFDDPKLEWKEYGEDGRTFKGEDIYIENWSSDEVNRNAAKIQQKQLETFEACANFLKSTSEKEVLSHDEKIERITLEFMVGILSESNPLDYFGKEDDSRLIEQSFNLAKKAAKYFDEHCNS